LHGADLGLGLCLGLVERADCDGYGDDGAGDGDVGGARASSGGLAIKDGPGGGEGVLEGGELVEERELGDLAGEGVELADEAGVVVEGAVGLGGGRGRGRRRVWGCGGICGRFRRCAGTRESWVSPESRG
jgi:hypothetical protein